MRNNGNCTSQSVGWINDDNNMSSVEDKVEYTYVSYLVTAAFNMLVKCMIVVNMRGRETKVK